MGCSSSQAAPAAPPPEQPQEDGAPAELKPREKPLIPDTGHGDDLHSNCSSRVASITTIGTPKSIPASHLDSVTNSMLRPEIDRESIDGRSMGIPSTCGTTRFMEEDLRSGCPSIPESRLDSQSYLMDLDKMVQDDKGGLEAERQLELVPDAHLTHGRPDAGI
eukprot:CAMPEP_0197908594 /NCGR_PEP_ID=MMETSP1439-20131203/67096_1 /TAXON_ID=66791 /ORGANISM="Gonyaulax spinifera, Strain CCMP409" /LENGTH=162 /DNA_ID=CAMNT_0043530097 /DNA_START=41 /DNA_END=528 /DNA_ORIENTATION=+